MALELSRLSLSPTALPARCVLYSLLRSRLGACRIHKQQQDEEDEEEYPEDYEDDIEEKEDDGDEVEDEAMQSLSQSGLASQVLELGSAWLGLAWLDLAWLGLAWLGLAWL